MAEKEPSGVDPSKFGTGAIGAVALAMAGLTSVLDFFTKAESTLGALSRSSAHLRWIVVACLAGIGAALLRESLRKRSWLRKPDAIVPRYTQSKHLLGRARELAELVEYCQQEQIVILSGASGIGKSALMRAGLTPALKEDKRLGLYPFYLRSWGTDWETGPAEELGKVIMREVGEGLDLKAAPHLAKLGEALEAVGRKLGLTPVVILDQFDEYQLRHRSKLRRNGAWLKPAELALANQFWALLARLLEKGEIKAVFIARNDNDLTDPLIATFVAARSYSVSALDPGRTDEFLAQLTEAEDGETYIADAEYGWTQLRRQLALDLARSKQVHPMQLSMAMRALPLVKPLNVAGYNAVGRLDGLLAKFIDGVVGRAAADANVSKDAVIEIAVRLINDDQTAAREVTQSELTRSDPKLGRAIATLKDSEIVRVRGEAQTARVTLFHDSFVGALLELKRRRAALSEQLERRHEEFQAASGWVARWRGLLPIGFTLRVLGDSKARATWLAHRTYALTSLLRLVPLACALILAISVGKCMRQDFAATQLLDKCFRTRSYTSSDICEKAFSEADAETRVLAVAIAWPGTEQLGVPSEQPLWPAQLSDQSGLVDEILIPCALGASPWHVYWDFHTGLPLLSMIRVEAPPELCARRAIEWTADKSHVAGLLVKNLLNYDAKTALAVLAEIDAATPASAWSVASLTPFVAKQFWEHPFDSPEFLDGPSSYRRESPAYSHASTPQLALGKRRLLEVISQVADAWASIRVWQAISEVGVSHDDVAVLQDHLLTVPVARGDYFLLENYIDVAAQLPSRVDYSKIALSYLPESAPPEVDKWIWTAILCDLGVDVQNLPFEIDPHVRDFSLSEEFHSGPFLWHEYPLTAFARAVACRYPSRRRENAGLVADLVVEANGTRRGTARWRGVPDGASWESDGARALAEIMPDLSSGKRVEVLERTLSAQRDNGLAISDVAAVNTVAASVSNGMELRTRKAICGRLLEGLGGAVGSAELSALAIAARHLCDQPPATELLAALKQTNRIDGMDAAWILSVIPDAELCKTPCFVFDELSRMTTDWTEDPTGVLSIAGRCPRTMCANAPRFVASVVAQLSSVTFVGYPLSAWELPGKLSDVAEMVTELAHKVPRDALGDLIREVLIHAAPTPVQLQRRAELHLRDGMVAALCGNERAAVTAILQSGRPDFDPDDCPGVPGIAKLTHPKGSPPLSPQPRMGRRF